MPSKYIKKNGVKANADHKSEAGDVEGDLDEHPEVVFIVSTIITVRMYHRRRFSTTGFCTKFVPINFWMVSFILF